MQGEKGSTGGEYSTGRVKDSIGGTRDSAGSNDNLRTGQEMVSTRRELNQ